MRRRLVVSLAVGALVALAAGVGFAGTKASSPSRSHHPSVDGRVTDREGGAVAHATVVVRPADNPDAVARQIELVTDETGHFHLDTLPAGTYWFIALGTTMTGASPALPVFDHLEVAIRLEHEATRA